MLIGSHRKATGSQVLEGLAPFGNLRRNVLKGGLTVLDTLVAQKAFNPLLPGACASLAGRMPRAAGRELFH